MNTKPFARSERVEQQVLKTINQILSKDLDLRKYGFLTFSDVKMTSDLKHANLFYSIINPTKDLKIINKELNLLVPKFRKYLSMSLKLRSTPTLKFIYDDSFEQFQKITAVVTNIACPGTFQKFKKQVLVSFIDGSVPTG